MNKKTTKNNTRPIENIRTMLLMDGVNFALVSSLTDKELYKLDEYDNYDDYNKELNKLAYKYDI